LPEESLREGSIVTIKQTQSLLIFSDETTSRTLDLRSDEVYMKGNSIIYKPSQGAYIILGPAISQQYDRITAKDDGLTVKSRSFEGGIMFFLIPWKEGGTTTVKLRRLDSQHDHQQKR
jgi:hypothetical protein